MKLDHKQLFSENNYGVSELPVLTVSLHNFLILEHCALHQMIFVLKLKDIGR